MFKGNKIPYLFILTAVFFFSLSFYKISGVNSQVKSFETMVVPNTFIGEFDISKLSINDLGKKLDEIETVLTSKNITLKANNQDLIFKLSELGIGINRAELYNEVLSYVNSTDYWTLYNSISKDSFELKTFDYKYVVNNAKLVKFLKNLSGSVNIIPKKGRLSMDSDRNLKYVDEVLGYNLNIEESAKAINSLYEKGEYVDNVLLVVDEAYEKDPLKNINTKISSFTTIYDDSVSRRYNLIAGAKYIDGVVLYPNEVFSFFDKAGPYNKEGYVYYLGMMGNGVCQVATTLYNAELLAGLTTVTRYNHGVKSVYVDGGLDATVAVTSGYVTDFKFKNTLSYPIYISAFASSGKLTVEIWSVENATNGKTYKTESIKHGYGSYEALRHVYQDGKYISTENLGRSYYFSE